MVKTEAVRSWKRENVHQRDDKKCHMTANNSDEAIWLQVKNVSNVIWLQGM
jgi:hypothetical protein